MNAQNRQVTRGVYSRASSTLVVTFFFLVVSFFTIDSLASDTEPETEKVKERSDEAQADLANRYPAVLIVETEGEIRREFYVIADSPGGEPYRDESGNMMKHGEYKEYEESTLWEYGNYRYGLRHGPYTVCKNWNCTEKTVTNYSKGLRRGYELGWYENGNLSFLKSPEDDSGDSVERIWRDDGSIVKECNYRHGKKHGYCRSWHENGQIEEERHYTNGIENGIERRWTENGQITYEVKWVGEKRDGQERVWYNGKLISTGRFENGKLVGKHLEFYPSGKIDCITDWTTDTTKKTCYDEDGNVTSSYRGQRAKEVLSTIFYPFTITFPIIMPGITAGMPLYLAAILDLWMGMEPTLKNAPSWIITIRPGWTGIKSGLGIFFPFFKVRKIHIFGLSTHCQMVYAWESSKADAFALDNKHIYLGPDLGFHLSGLDLRIGALLHMSNEEARRDWMITFGIGFSALAPIIRGFIY